MLKFPAMTCSRRRGGDLLEEALSAALYVAAMSLLHLFQNVEMAETDTIEFLLACKPRSILFISTNDETVRLRLEDRLSERREYRDATDASDCIAPSSEFCPTHAMRRWLLCEARTRRDANSFLAYCRQRLEWGDHIENDIDNGVEAVLPPRETINLSVGCWAPLLGSILLRTSTMLSF